MLVTLALIFTRVCWTVCVLVNGFVHVVVTVSPKLFSIVKVGHDVIRLLWTIREVNE